MKTTMDTTGSLTADECQAYLELVKGQDDFLQKHSGFIITIVGIASALIGGVFTYFLRSRCEHIKLGCISLLSRLLERSPPDAHSKLTFQFLKLEEE